MPYTSGWVLATIAEGALDSAIDAVDFDNLDGKAVFDALCNMKDFDMGGIMPPLSYGPGVTWTDRQGGSAIKMTEVQNGKVVILSDWLRTPDYSEIKAAAE